MTTSVYSFGEYSVSFAVEEENPLGKLDDLHICHLGMRFISARKLPEFSAFEFEMSLKPAGENSEPEQVQCCGMVVSSEPEGDGFRTVIHFVNLDESDSSCLEAVTKAQNMRCDYCGNC